MTTPAAPAAAPFIDAGRAAEVLERFGTPCYVYDHASLEATARRALAFGGPYGFTLRYAMKANPSHGVLEVFRALGLQIDASSDWEVDRALRSGFSADQIQLTSQMPSKRLAEFIDEGVRFNASWNWWEAWRLGRRSPYA
jgi:diaminopimelate decarboxylase